MTASPPGAALRYPDFRLYQGARFAGVVGTQIVSVAVGWQVYEATRRPLDLGYVGLAQFLPAFLLALPAGQVADRVDRRRIVALCQAVYAFVAVLLLVTSVGRVGGPIAIYGLLVLFGAARGFSGPAGQ